MTKLLDVLPVACDCSVGAKMQVGALRKVHRFLLMSVLINVFEVMYLFFPIWVSFYEHSRFTAQ